MRKTKSGILSMVLAFVLVTIMCVPAFAYSATYSATSTVTVGGHTYNYCSYIENLDIELSARVKAETESRTSVPIGYIGLRSRMYSEAGSLAAMSEWSYNELPCISSDVPVSKVTQSNVYFYSRGEVKFYNGNGYSTYTANASPVMRLGTRSIPTVQINENGDVYGSEIFLDAIGVKADLISAIGENGVEGYVKATDLNGPDPKTPAEAVQQQVRVNRTIPLYESDGETVIGSFVIQNNTSTVIK